MSWPKTINYDKYDHALYSAVHLNHLRCSLGLGIVRVGSAHHVSTPKGHPRSVTSSDLTYTTYRIFDIFTGFLAAGIEYDDYTWKSSMTVPHWHAHVMTPAYDVTDLTYDVIMATVRDFCISSQKYLRYMLKRYFFWSRIERGTRWWRSHVAIWYSFLAIDLQSWKGACFAKFWPLTCHKYVKCWPRVNVLDTIV